MLDHPVLDHPRLDFHNRGVIITGAGHGIGKATAELFAKAGARVVVADIEEGPALDACRQIQNDGGIAVPFPGDISAPGAAERMADLALREFGRIDILFANAAIQLVKPAGETTEAEWDRIMNVNLKGVFLSCRAVVPAMRSAKHGVIVIAASGHAFATYPGFSAYAATKAAAVAFMRGVALDYAADGIRANCIIPGATDTRMIQSYFDEASDPAAARAKMCEAIPMRRMATPADIGNAVLLLASDYASYITGTCLAVDGGLMAKG